MFRNGLRAGLLATTLLTAASAHAHDSAVTTELKQFGGLPHAAATDGRTRPRRSGAISGRSPSPSRPRAPMRSATSTRAWRSPTGSTMPKRGGAFRTAQSLDPNCAMCFWGEALVLGPNINSPMDAAADAAGACGDCEGSGPCGRRERAGAGADRGAVGTLLGRPSRGARHARPGLCATPCRRWPSAFRTISTSPSSTRKR